MTHMPEKIWAYRYSGARKKGQFLTSNTPVYGSTEYIRSGIERNEALEAAAKDMEFLARAEEEANNPRDAELLYYAAKHIRAMKREPDA